MAEDESKREEEKFEFTPEGEVIGYISLAQARLLAMQTARESPGDYGGQYGNASMVFAVVESGEDEDYYTVILSIRPEAEFSGTPGQEQFFISKEGEVALRQVLNPPRSRRRWRLPVVVAGVTVVIVALVLGASSLFGSGPFGAQSSLPPKTTAPSPTEVPLVAIVPTQAATDTPLSTPTSRPAPTSTSSPTGNPQFGQLAVTILPGAPARVKSASGDVVIDVAAGSVAAPTRMEIRSLSPPEFPPLPLLFRATGKSFDLTTGAPLLKPITIRVQVSEAEAALAGGDEANIVIQHWRGEAWAPLATDWDRTDMMAKAQVDSLSIFALTIKEPGPPPAAGAATTTATGSVGTAYSQGVALNSAGEYEKAIEKFDEAIRLDPLNAAVYSSRGFAYLHTGQNQQAIQDYDEAIRLGPERVDVFSDYYNRGFVYNAIGQPQRAIQDYTEAIRLNPVQGFLYEARAAVYDIQGEDQKAKSDRDKACQIDRTYCVATVRSTPIATLTPTQPKPTSTPANTAPNVEVHIGTEFELDVASAPYNTVLVFSATVTDDHDPDSFFGTGGQSPMVWTSNLGRSEPGLWGDTILWVGKGFLIMPEIAGLKVGTHIITGTATDSSGLVGSGSAQITITP